MVRRPPCAQEPQPSSQQQVVPAVQPCLEHSSVAAHPRTVSVVMVVQQDLVAVRVVEAETVRLTRLPLLQVQTDIWFDLLALIATSVAVAVAVSGPEPRLRAVRVEAPQAVPTHPAPVYRQPPTPVVVVVVQLQVVSMEVTVAPVS